MKRPLLSYRGLSSLGVGVLASHYAGRTAFQGTTSLYHTISVLNRGQIINSYPSLMDINFIRRQEMGTLPFETARGKDIFVRRSP